MLSLPLALPQILRRFSASRVLQHRVLPPFVRAHFHAPGIALVIRESVRVPGGLKGKAEVDLFKRGDYRRRVISLEVLFAKLEGEKHLPGKQ